MPAPLTAPGGARLESLGLEPAAGDEPWVRSVRFDTARGTVTLTWDTVAASTHLLWVRGDEVLVEVTRETVEAVTVDHGVRAPVPHATRRVRSSQPVSLATGDARKVACDRFRRSRDLAACA